MTERLRPAIREGRSEERRPEDLARLRPPAPPARQPPLPIPPPEATARRRRPAASSTASTTNSPAPPGGAVRLSAPPVPASRSRRAPPAPKHRFEHCRREELDHLHGPTPAARSPAAHDPHRSRLPGERAAGRRNRPTTGPGTPGAVVSCPAPPPGTLFRRDFRAFSHSGSVPVFRSRSPVGDGTRTAPAASAPRRPTRRPAPDRFAIRSRPSRRRTEPRRTPPAPSAAPDSPSEPTPTPTDEPAEAEEHP